MPRAETLAIVLTPLVAMATFALGLRVGAAGTVQAAVVYAALPSAGRPGLAWQLLTLKDERGVREAISLPGVSVEASAGARTATWRGSTNADGIAEAWLDLPGVRDGDPVDLVVRANGEPRPLAEGRARWSKGPWGPTAQTSPWVQASKRDGELAVDVAIYGQKLAPGFPASVWVRVQDHEGKPVEGASVEAEPEPGLTVASPYATTCANGWAEIVATAQMHVAGLSVHASRSGRTTAPGSLVQRGEWFGSLPVAPGGNFVVLPTEVLPGKEIPVRVTVPTVRPLVYLEVDDAQGRAFAATLKVETSGGDLPHADTTLPPLLPGLYWVVTAGEPRGAESLEVATIARPLLVRDGAPMDRCTVGPLLATKPAAPFERWVALDGTADDHAKDGGRRKRGLVIAFGSLAAAALLEVLLLLRAASRARREMAKVAAALADGEGPGPELAPRFTLANVAIGLLLALLGFALVASLLTWRAG